MTDHPDRDDLPRNPDVRLADGAFYASSPEVGYAWMRDHAPVYWDPSSGIWGVSRYADLKTVSKDPATFSNAGGIRPGLGPQPMMIDMDDPDHWHRRKLVNRGFTPRRVRDSEPTIRQVCHDILDAICDGGSADLVRDIAAPLPMIMIGDMLGVAPEDRDDLLRWSDELVEAQNGTSEDEVAVKAAAPFAEYYAYASAVIEARRAQATDDLMSVLVHAEVDGDRLTHDELIFESLLILVGGDETTRHVISEGVAQLLRHRDQWDALRVDASLIPSAVEEMLRWVSPIKTMARTVTRDVELGGSALRAGDELVLLYASANRDPEVFTEPERFDVRRSPNDHVAFGFGAHFCLGNSLARLEIAVMLEVLLERMPDLTLVGDEVPMRAASFITGPTTVPVRFSPSSPLTRT